MPMVSGRFFSCVKFLIVCGALSSRDAAVVLAQVGDEALLVAHGHIEVDQVDADVQGVDVEVSGGGAAVLAGGGPEGEGASCARPASGARASTSKVTAEERRRIPH